MKIVLLGGSGFIGVNLCAALLDAGHEVCVFSRTFSRLNLFDPNSRFKWKSGDINNTEQLDDVLTGCDCLYHLVSSTKPKSSSDNPAFDITSNVVSTIGVLESAAKNGVKKLIFISSGGTVYGIPDDIPISESHRTEPICSYGIGKLTIEKYLEVYRRDRGLNYTVLRLSNPYGPFQSVDKAQGAISVFSYKSLVGEEIEIWGDGSVVRDYIYIADTIEALVKIIHYTGKERVFNLGSGIGYTLNNILEVLELLLEKPISKKYLQHRSFDVPINVLASNKLQEEISWKPTTSFEEGIRKTLENIKELYSINSRN